MGGSIVLSGENRDSEIGLCYQIVLAMLVHFVNTANFRIPIFPNSTADPPITYTKHAAEYSYSIIHNHSVIL